MLLPWHAGQSCRQRLDPLGADAAAMAHWAKSYGQLLILWGADAAVALTRGLSTAPGYLSLPAGLSVFCMYGMPLRRSFKASNISPQ
jgi:hypothetical protein